MPPSTLPTLLRTPSGLALLELQGTLNLPLSVSPGRSLKIGRLEFPDYNPASPAFEDGGTKWMRRVHMYVGRHQRLHGEVKKLPNPMGVVSKRRGGGVGGEELEVIEVVKYKILFSGRPEPVETELALEGQGR